MVLTVISILVLGVQLLSGLAEVGRNPSAAVGLCLFVIPLALMGLLLTWLIQAIRNAPRIMDARLGNQAQYTQSMHQAQMYQQPPGYYPQQPPPPPPPSQGGWSPQNAPPPPPPPDQDQR